MRRASTAIPSFRSWSKQQQHQNRNWQTDLKEVSMQTKSASKKIRLATQIMIVFGLFAFGASAVAQSKSESGNSGRCSNRMLNGDYGCSVQGVLLNAPGLPPEATFVAVTTSHFDGKGNVTGTEHA